MFVFSAGYVSLSDEVMVVCTIILYSLNIAHLPVRLLDLPRSSNTR